MRHNKKISLISRKKSHRDAVVKNLLAALLRYEQIETTESKAAALSVFANRFLNRLMSIREDYNVIRHIKKKLHNSSRTVISIAQEFKAQCKKPLTNYVQIQKQYIRSSDTAKIVSVRLIR